MNTMPHTAKNEIIPDDQGAQAGARDPKPIFNMTNQEFGWQHLVFVRAADIIVRNSDKKNAEAVAKMTEDGIRNKVIADLEHTEKALIALSHLVGMAREIAEGEGVPLNK